MAKRVAQHECSATFKADESDLVTIVTPHDLGDNKEFAFQIAASSFLGIYSKWFRAREEGESTLVDTASEEALLIKPLQLDPAFCAKATSAFGSAPFRIHPEKCYIEKMEEWIKDDDGKKIKTSGVVVKERMEYGSDLKFFFANKDLLAIRNPSASSSNENEYATISIDTGKGGRQTYKVLKTDAGDMMG